MSYKPIIYSEYYLDRRVTVRITKEQSEWLEAHNISFSTALRVGLEMYILKYEEDNKEVKQ